MTVMQGIQNANPTGGPAGLELIELPIPTISNPHDIVVKVRAVALNPGDTKVRAMNKAGTIMGMDGAGVVIEAGTASRFTKGDEVLWSFSGELTRHGSNAQYELVDSRLVGRKPETLPWDEAAALPLVGLTAWEMFEDKFRVRPGTKNDKEVLLVVNGAGGVGAIAIQLAKKVFGIDRVIATAGRPETVDFVKRMGATDIISHREDIGSQLQALGVKPTLVFLNADTPRYIKEVGPHLAPFAQIGSISECTEALPLQGPEFFFGSVSFHWEFMGAKGAHKQGLEAQGLITDRLAQLAADGTLVSMVTKRFPLSLATMRAGHELQESGSVIGKLVFTVGDSIA